MLSSVFLCTKTYFLYADHQRKRHDVRPGLTGLAQVNGRNAISWEEKFDYDISYVTDISFLKDIKIILRTVKKVFVRDGISDSTTETAKPFTGEGDGSEKIR